MKIIKVPYKENLQLILYSIITILAICGIIYMILAIIKLDWKALFIGSLIAIPTSVFVWKTMTSQILIWTKDFMTIKTIYEINNEGFTVNHNQKKTRIQWKEIQNIQLAHEKDLLIKLNNGKVIKIDDTYHHWFYLLKNIPKSKLTTSAIPDFLERTFKTLKTCKICGSIAINHRKCLSCNSSCFDQNLKKEFTNEADYIKAEQLELFSTDDPHEKVDFYPHDKYGFARDENWKPMVTIDEVIQYSKENNWK